MVELIKYVIGSFAEQPDKIDYEVIERGNMVTVKVTLDPGDMGKVIGKQGRIAKAIRTLVKAAAIKAGERVTVEIV